MAALIIAEHDNHMLNPNTINTLSAATKLGDDLHVLVAGHHVDSVVDQVKKISVVNKVLVAEHESLANGLAENIAWLVKNIASQYFHVLAPASNFGKNFMPRVAAMLDVMLVSDIIKVVSINSFMRPIYAGNALMTVESCDPIIILTVRSTAFDEVDAEGGSATVEEIGFNQAFDRIEFVSREVTRSDRPDLATARIVVSGGRGVGSKKNFLLIESLAEKLGAAVGASRAAVDSGYVSNDYQVGQTGKVVAPELYFAVGISGAIQHQAGMSESKVIVAINTDVDAPIFQIADYGIVADLFDVVPELIEELDSGNTHPRVF